MKQLLCIITGIQICISVLALDFEYHDQSQVEIFLSQLSRDYPQLAQVYSIGKSVNGEKLNVIAIGENISKYVTLKPHVKYIGNMHGNEVVSREVLLHLVEHLVTNFGKDERVTHLLRNTVVHVMPTMNPDGFKVSHVRDCNGLEGRANAHGYDLNRNFPDLFHGNSHIIQPETQAVMTWLRQQQFVLSANIHGGSLVVNFPFDNFVDGKSRTPDNDVFKHISLAYSSVHPRMHLQSTCPGEGDHFKNGTTNGAEWYPVNGGMQDYNYLYAGCLETTIEMSCCKYPPKEDLPGFWGENMKPLMAYLEQVLMGVKGLITDENNNPVVGAVVSVAGREVSTRKPTTRGEYWHLLLPGHYELQVTANGYHPKSKRFVVNEGEITRIDIVLPSVDHTKLEYDSKRWTKMLKLFNRWK